MQIRLSFRDGLRFFVAGRTFAVTVPPALIRLAPCPSAKVPLSRSGSASVLKRMPTGRVASLRGLWRLSFLLLLSSHATCMERLFSRVMAAGLCMGAGPLGLFCLTYTITGFPPFAPSGPQLSTFRSFCSLARAFPSSLEGSAPLLSCFAGPSPRASLHTPVLFSRFFYFLFNHIPLPFYSAACFIAAPVDTSDVGSAPFAFFVSFFLLSYSFAHRGCTDVSYSCFHFSASRPWDHLPATAAPRRVPPQSPAAPPD